MHRNSSTDRLYTLRPVRRRGLNSIYDIYVTRIFTLHTHLVETANVNKYLDLVLHHEEDLLSRIANEFKTALGVNENAANISSNTKDTMKNQHKEAYEEKSQHGFVHRQQASIEDYNKTLSTEWLVHRGTISHAVGYICTIQEQEINTRALKAKRENSNNPDFDKKCRFCHQRTEDIFHLLGSCGCLSAGMYLPMRHNMVAMVVYNEII